MGQPRTGIRKPGRVDRRRAIGLMGAGFAAFAVPAARAAVDETAGRVSLIREGERIGEGYVAYGREGSRLKVRVALEATITFGFITVFRYRHESEELWQDGRLVALDGHTNDDGEHYEMTARPVAAGLAVEGTKGNFTAPADVLPLSYWHPDTVNRRQWLDASKGRLLTVSVVPVETESVEVATRRVLARRYAVTGDGVMTLWYDPSRAWVMTRFKKKGSDVDLVLDDPPLLTASLMAPALVQDWALLGATASNVRYPAD